MRSGPGRKMVKIIFFETGLIPIVKKQKLLSFARVSRIFILTVFGRQKFIKRFSGLDSKANGRMEVLEGENKPKVKIQDTSKIDDLVKKSNF